MKIISKGEYNYTVDKNHPSCTKNGYVLFHRKVMENHLGRYLSKHEIVHHKDGNKKNNELHNLEVMLRTEHSSLHAKHGRTVISCTCANCGLVFHREKGITYKRYKRQFCSRACNGKFNGFKSK
jgi:predicted Zn-ribbon and HTH transcriptional regulator